MDNRMYNQVEIGDKVQEFCQVYIIRTATYNVRTIKDEITELQKILLENTIDIRIIIKKVNETTVLEKYIMPKNERAQETE